MAEARRIAEARKAAAALLRKPSGPEATPAGTPKAPLKAATAVQPPVATGAAPSTGKVPVRMGPGKGATCGGRSVCCFRALLASVLSCPLRSP